MSPPAPRQGWMAPRRTLVRCISGILLALIIITSIIVVSVWLSVQPKQLRYSIEWASITGFHLSHDRLNAKFHFRLRADNPNRRVSLYYDRIKVTVLYENDDLSANDVHPFYQCRRNVTFVDLVLAAKDAVVDEGMARELRMSRPDGDVKLDLEIRAGIRLKVGFWKTRRRLKVDCRSLKVPFDKNKEFQSVACLVDVNDI